jgi:folate-dependent phosphoribosylglycinamide formyltransferase PurN
VQLAYYPLLVEMVRLVASRVQAAADRRTKILVMLKQRESPHVMRASGWMSVLSSRMLKSLYAQLSPLLCPPKAKRAGILTQEETIQEETRSQFSMGAQVHFI